MSEPALAAAAIVVMAVRRPPVYPIAPLSLASLAKAGIEAGARIGDEDVVQAAEDELRSFPATEVVLVTGTRGRDAAGDAAAADLESRLEAPFRRLCIGDSPSTVGAEVRHRAPVTRIPA